MINNSKYNKLNSLGTNRLKRSRFILNYDKVHLKRMWEYKIKKKPHNFPSVIQIQTINCCNASCSMCPNSKIKNRKIEIMSDKLFKKIINEINKKSRSRTIVLMYLQNEPLMDENLFKKIKMIKNFNNKNILVGFLSNGRLFTNKRIKELENSDIDFISISLDAITRETYEKIRGDFEFEIILNKIYKLLISKYDNQRIAVEFVLQKDNIKEFSNFKKYWKKKVGSIVINYLTNRSGDLSDFKDICCIKNDYSYLDRFKFMIWKKIIRFCPIPFTAFEILSNGDVVLCRDDYTKKLILGNLNESSIEDIWISKEYEKIRNSIYNKKYIEIAPCKNCTRWASGYLKHY